MKHALVLLALLATIAAAPSPSPKPSATPAPPPKPGDTFSVSIGGVPMTCEIATSGAHALGLSPAIKVYCY